MPFTDRQLAIRNNMDDFQVEVEALRREVQFKDQYIQRLSMEMKNMQAPAHSCHDCVSDRIVCVKVSVPPPEALSPGGGSGEMPSWSLKEE